MTVLLVGQAPAAKMSDDDRAFERSDTLRRMARYAGTTPEWILENCRTVNLIEKWPGKASDGKHDIWSRSLARLGAVRVRQQIFAEDPHDPNRVTDIVTFGRATSNVFGAKWDYFHTDRIYFNKDGRLTDGSFDEWLALPVTTVPHPGGTVRWWNDPNNRALAERELPRLLGLT